jgi:myo-inositol-1(or 4)-monophosphatase
MMAVEATPKIWDLAAAWLVVVEAGGILESWQQQPIFPLAAVNGEYVSRPMPVFAAANQSILHEFVAGLSFSNPQ